MKAVIAHPSWDVVSGLVPRLVGMGVGTSLIWAVDQTLPPCESLATRDYRKRTVIDGFRKIICAPPSLDSKTGHYISTAAYRTSLSRHGTATQRSEIRPHRVQQPEHTLPRLPEVHRMPVTDTSVYSGYAVVLSTVLANQRLRTIECLSAATARKMQ